MKKLNLQEKEIVMQKYKGMGNLMINQIEKLKLDYKDLDDAMDTAYDFICEME